MASSPGDDATDLDRLADAIVPSFRRKPSLPPPPPSAKATQAESAPPAAAALLDVIIPPSAPLPKIDMPVIADPVEVPPAAPVEVAAAPTAEAPSPAPLETKAEVAAAPGVEAPRSDRNDATPISIPQVNRPVESAAQSAATVPPPHTAPAAPKGKKQLRSVPEPSIKAEASPHKPSPRVQAKEDGPKIVFNDPQAPSRLPTMPMAQVDLSKLRGTPTLRPAAPRAKSPLLPLALVTLAVVGLGGIVLSLRGEPAASKASPAPAVVPVPAAAPVAAPVPPPAPVEHDREVPPPPAADEVAAEPAPLPSPAPTTKPATPAPAPAIAPAARVAAPSAPTLAPAATPAPAPVPSTATAAPIKRDAPPVPAAAPIAPISQAPAVPAKAPAPAKAANSAPAPAIVRDNPF